MVATIDDIAEHRMAETPEKEEDPHALLETVEKRRKDLSELIETINQAHSEAYDTAARKHLEYTTKTGAKRIGHSRLKDPKIQEAMADEMAKFYETKAREHFGVGEEKKLDDLEKEMLIGAYAGINRSTLYNVITSQKDKFTKKVVRKIQDDYAEALMKSLGGHVTGHLKESHIKPLIKHMGIDDLVNAEQVKLDDARKLALNYVTAGTISPKELEEEPYYKGPKDEKGGKVIPLYKVKKPEEEKKAA